MHLANGCLDVVRRDGTTTGFFEGEIFTNGTGADNAYIIFDHGAAEYVPSWG
jgi:hypothetical protein